MNDSITDVDVAKKLINLHASARDRVLPFNLSFATVKRLLKQKRCFYSNKPFDKDPTSNDNHRTIDRIDNQLGYIEGNVVASRYIVNQYKADMSIDQINRLAIALNQLVHGIEKNNLQNKRKKELKDKREKEKQKKQKKLKTKK